MTTTARPLHDLIDATVSIPTIPATLMAINEIVQSPEGTAKQAGGVIERDPALATKVLRLVNSSFYALRNPVGSVPLACSILGLKMIRNIVVQATVLETFSQAPELAGFDPQWLWDHSFKTALGARMLAQAAPGLGIDRDEAYTCGLIHDVGKMVLLQSQAPSFAVALGASRRRNVPLARTEYDKFGFSHAHVGGLLAQRWKLSPTTQLAVTAHHGAAGGDERGLAFLVSVANGLAHEVAPGSGGWVGERCDAVVLQRLGIEKPALDEIREAVRAARVC
jgi:putative nucleotidyltransferase with HDIG domain